MKRIFISGKITGLSRSEASDNFYNAEAKLKGEGNECFNPIRMADKVGWNLPYSYYMSECLKELPYCDAVYMIKNWRESRGARIEHHVAKELGLEVIYEEVLPSGNYTPLDDAMTC